MPGSNLRKSKENKSNTLVGIFRRSVSKYPDNPIFWEKLRDNYQATTYFAIQKEVDELAAGLLSHGVKKGDHIALLSLARKDWIVSELAILHTGAINVPLSVKLDEAELVFRLNHSESKILITSGYDYNRLKSYFKELKNLEKVIVLDPVESNLPLVVHVDELRHAGKEFLIKNRKILEQQINEIKPDDCALISYTSGTTADPKGIMLSHRNMVTNCYQSLGLFTIEENYRTLLILPLDHSFAHTTGMYVFILCGASLASVQLAATPAATLKNVSANIEEIQPDVLLSVPTLAKNLRKNIENGIRKKGGIVNWLYRTGLRTGYYYIGNGWNRGTGLSWLAWPSYKLIDGLVFKKIRQSLGGKLKFFVGGGALLDEELQKFFYTIGIPMYQGYGLSEASPVISANTIENHKIGSSGKIVPELELKILDEGGNRLAKGEKGEIVVRGDNVMLGYFKNQKATSEVLRDGWLHTGDMGFVDKDDFLIVLGRFKSLLIADDGEKYSPEGIEEYMVEKSPYISQVMIYNNQKKYSIALVYPEEEMLKKFIKKNKLQISSLEGQKAVVGLFQQLMDQFRDEKYHLPAIPKRWMPAAFAILDEGFNEKNHFLNSTLKMVRGKISNHYHDRIEYLYTPEGKNPFNSENFKAVEKLLYSA